MELQQSILTAQTQVFLHTISKALRPAPNLTIAEWSDTYRKLPDGKGKWKTDDFPHLREIMEAITLPEVREVVFKKPSQVGWTEVILNVLGYYISLDPCGIMVCLPTVTPLAQRFAKIRFDRFVDTTPNLKSLFENLSREEKNTLMKIFPGGFLVIGGSNSPRSLASLPCRLVIGDEISGFKDSSGAEGSALRIMEKRVLSYWNSKKLFGSSPHIDGACQITKRYELSDKRVRKVPCPHCGEYQTLPMTMDEFYERVHWQKDEFGNHLPETAAISCTHCDALFDDSHLFGMLRKGYWEPTVETDGTIRGYWISGFYSPQPGMSIVNIVRDYLAAKSEGNEALQVWVNTMLGDVWVQPDVSEGIENIEPLTDNYGGAEVPWGVAVLVLAADVQADRIEAEVIGFGLNGESWGIGYHILEGKLDLPTTFKGRTSRQNVWRQLDLLRAKSFTHASGTSMQIRITVIDRGYKTNKVDEYVKERNFQNVYAVKGRPGIAQPIAEIAKTGKIKRRFVWVGTHQAKTTIYERLQAGSQHVARMHYPIGRGYDQDYFDMLTSERMRIRTDKNGNEIKEFYKPKGKRNEALDIRVYSLAALEVLTIDGITIERHAKQQGIELKNPDAPPPAIEPKPEQALPEPATKKVVKPKAKKSNKHNRGGQSGWLNRKGWGRSR